jgi:hypothetical protein
MRPNEVEVTLPPDTFEPVYLLGRVETPCGSEILIELRDEGWGISFAAGGSPGFSMADPSQMAPPPAVEEALWRAAEALMTQDLAAHPDFPTAFAGIAS